MNEKVRDRDAFLNLSAGYAPQVEHNFLRALFQQLLQTGAGIGGFFTPTGVGTKIADGQAMSESAVSMFTGANFPGASAVCTSMPVDHTEPVAAWEVENIRHGLNGHQWSLPTSEPRQNMTVSARTMVIRHVFATRPSRSTPVSTRSG